MNRDVSHTYACVFIHCSHTYAHMHVHRDLHTEYEIDYLHACIYIVHYIYMYILYIYMYILYMHGTCTVLNTILTVSLS